MRKIKKSHTVIVKYIDGVPFYTFIPDHTPTR